MSKIRMNTEYRNKLYNRIKDVFEKEDTQERQGFLEARENFENKQTTAFELARQVVERSYPCLLYTSPSPRDVEESRMPSSA